MWEAFLAFCSGVMVILACNPLSMFLFNLFFPENAARFVREFIGFNDSWRRFYQKSALKWPLWWSAAWITPENLKTCGVRKQVAYYLANINRSQTLRAMSSEAQVALVHKRYEQIREIYGIMHLTDKMFAEWLQQLVKKDRKTCFISGYREKLYEPLCDYLKRGKLPFSQVMILTRAAVDEHNNSACPFMKYLEDYIERFGLRKNQLDKIAQYMCDNLYWSDTFDEEPTTDFAKALKKRDEYNHYYNFLLERQINYEQRVFTRSQRGDRLTDEWKTFCEKTRYIHVSAQKEMDIEQYRLFHGTGHTLNKEAIFTFLSYPDRKLHRLVFLYEPLEIFEEKELKTFIERNAPLKTVFEEATGKHK